MRLGVLDVGSNTVHLLVVDAHRGGHPDPVRSHKAELHLVDLLAEDGSLGEAGATALATAVAEARVEAEAEGVEDLLAFATSAVREATDGSWVLDQVEQRAGVRLVVLPGEDEARLTFLALRRWFGWSSGRLLCLDIGGGSLELATGRDESPDVALSLPLGAGRLARAYGDAPGKRGLADLRSYVRDTLAEAVPTVAAAGRPDRAVVSSKTFRALARLGGAAPSSEGPRVPRRLTLASLEKTVSLLANTSVGERSRLPGVSDKRAGQLLPGAIVAQEALTACGLASVEVCPWALREGVILSRLDFLAGA